MARKVFISCAVTGNAPFNPKHPNFPVTPKEISDACQEAALAGASAVHIHARDIKTKLGVHDPVVFKEIVDRVRDSGTDIVINLTAGNGAFLCPDPADEAKALPESDILSVEERVAHLDVCRPDIASIDVTTGNQVEGDREFVYMNTTRTLRGMLKFYKEFGVKPEIEVFSAGDLMFVHQLVKEGLVDSPPLIQFVLGVQWGAPADAETVLYLRDKLPAQTSWAALGIAKDQMKMAALSIAMGGHVRVGLEDNLYLRRGEFATNGQLVERAVTLIDILGQEVATPSDMRKMLNLNSAV